MNGIRVIPIFLFLIIMSFLGAVFVEANNQSVVVYFWGNESPSMKLGLVILISCFIGTLFAGFLCSIEILALAIENKRLRRRLRQMASSQNRTSVTQEQDKDSKSEFIQEGSH